MHLRILLHFYRYQCQRFTLWICKQFSTSFTVSQVIWTPGKLSVWLCNMILHKRSHVLWLSFEKLHYFTALSKFLGKHFLEVQPSPGHSEQGFQATTIWTTKHFFRFAIAFTRQMTSHTRLLLPRQFRHGCMWHAQLKQWLRVSICYFSSALHWFSLRYSTFMHLLDLPLAWAYNYRPPIIILLQHCTSK